MQQEYVRKVATRSNWTTYYISRPLRFTTIIIINITLCDEESAEHLERLQGTVVFP